jgi:hypothetical protein
VVTGALLAWLRLSPGTPQVEGVRPFTDDNEGKDEFATIETDGSRVYFTEKYRGSFRLAQVAASGGQAAQVTTQIAAPHGASMAPDFSGLLVSENAYGRHPVWFQPLRQAIHAAWETLKPREQYSRQKASRFSISMVPRSTLRIGMVQTRIK